MRESAGRSQTSWQLTKEALIKFLNCLDPNLVVAGEKYEKLRMMLVKFLDWRGALFPDELVDETFNRVMRKLEEGETISDIKQYCYGVARLVFLQSLQDQQKKRVDLIELAMTTVQEIDRSDIRIDCLRNCMRKLSPEDQMLIIEYYQKEKRQKIDHRISMAARLGVVLNALRSRVHRIRCKLERCIVRCGKDYNIRIK